MYSVHYNIRPLITNAKELPTVTENIIRKVSCCSFSIASGTTALYVQEHHYDTRESLQMSFEEISEKWKESRKADNMYEPVASSRRA